MSRLDSGMAGFAAVCRLPLPLVFACGLLLAACESRQSQPQRDPDSPLSPTDFLFADESDRLKSPSTTRYRTPADEWTQEEIDRFWIPPQEIGLEWLQEEADGEIERLLHTIR